MGVKQRVFKRKVHRITVLQELKPADYPRRFHVTKHVARDMSCSNNKPF
jgi:hypothetical protein